MTKTLALIAALGLVVSAPAFATEAAKAHVVATAAAPAAGTVVKEEKKEEKKVEVKKEEGKKAEGAK